MSLSGWARPAVATVMMVLGIFGVYWYVDHTYGAANASSASQPIVPVWSPGDEGASSAQQQADTPAPTPLPTLAAPPSSGATRTPIDPWTSEVMEAALRGPLVEEPNEPDEAVEGAGLLGSASGESADHLEGPVPPEVGSQSFETPFSENMVAYSQNPAQPPPDQYTGVAPQQATTPAASGSPTDTETPSPLPTNAPVPWDVDDAGEGSDEPKRILIVEDPRALGEGLATLLNRQLGFEVVGRTSSASGCRNFVVGEQGFDVAVVDLFLPDGQGASLIEELRRSCPHAPVLVLTESLDPSYYERAMKAGADAVLGREAGPEEILSVVRSLSLN
jgi:CheY-like chemotaxis protein